MSVNQVKVVIARAGIDGKVFERREMVLQVEAGLSVFDSATEAESTAGIQIENLRVAAAINEENFQLAQAREINPGFQNMPMPQVDQIAFAADGKRAA